MRGGEVHRLSVLLFTDIVGSVQLQQRLGTQDYARLLKRHDELFRQAMENTSGQILKHTGDGFLAEFSMSSAAVAAALRFQRLLHAEAWIPEPLQARVGLHQGEVLVVNPNDANEAAPLAVGMAVNLAARVMDLGLGGQILITRPVYENARYYLKDHLDEDGAPSAIRWVSHGAYEFKGRDEPMDILEVGFEDLGVFTAPEGGSKGRRSRSAPVVETLLDLDAVNDSDVFISYANLDNQPLAEGEIGWVTRLHDSLSLRLNQLLGRSPRVWRDPKPNRDDPWHEELESRLKTVQTLVPVISPPYLQAPACKRELRTFGRDAEDPSRMVQVVKTPAESDDSDPDTQRYLNESTFIEFFERDSAGRFQQFDSSLGEEPRRRFLHGVYDLAYEISKRVKSPAARGAPEKVIYLAETTYDLREARKRIQRDFQERGYRVLPDRPLPLEVAELETRVATEMEQADAVIHLVGKRYGVVPEGSDRSLVELQCQISAAQLAREKKRFARFFWAPKLIEFDDPRQAEFFTALEQGEFSMDETEFIRGSIEELKRLTLARLAKAEEAEVKGTSDAPGSESGVRMIYLVCDPEDHEAVEPLEDHLFDLGYEVKVSPNDGDSRLRSEMHREILTLCDGVLIYFGQGSHQWVEMNLMDILKAPGYGRKEPITAQGVYIAPPTNRRKDRFRTRSALVMQGEHDEFSPESLTPFLDRLGPAKLPAHA